MSFDTTVIRDRIESSLLGAEIVDIDVVDVTGVAVVEAHIGFNYVHPRRDEGMVAAQGRLLIRAQDAERVLDGGERLPLVHAAGYEIPSHAAMEYLAQGAVFATPLEPDPNRAAEYNPCMRGVNLDVAWLHVVRALPFVDVERMLITGGSAGGYMGLMLAAESFPLGGAMLINPAVSLRYHFQYLSTNAEVAMANRDALPVFSNCVTMPEGSYKLFCGPERNRLLDANSPNSHLHRISCPVQITHSTADVLVPFSTHIGDIAAARFDAALFPPRFVLAPEDVGIPEGVVTLLDRIPDAAITTLRVPRESPRFLLDPEACAAGVAASALPPPVFAVGWPPSGWQVVVLDEGPPDPLAGHVSFISGFDRSYAAMLGAAAGDATHLTPAKLELLMDRLRGAPWIEGELSPLDIPEREQRDVLGGLRAWCSTPQRAQRLAELYAALPAERRLLGAALPADVEGMAQHLESARATQVGPPR